MTGIANSDQVYLEKFDSFDDGFRLAGAGRLRRGEFNQPLIPEASAGEPTPWIRLTPSPIIVAIALI